MDFSRVFVCVALGAVALGYTSGAAGCGALCGTNHDSSPGTLTITFRNNSDAPLFIRNAYPSISGSSITANRVYQIEQDGQTLALGDPCASQFLCSGDNKEGENCGCFGEFARQTPRKLEAGGTFTATWSGLTLVDQDVPDSCDCGSCYTETAVTGTVTVTAHVSPALECNESGADSCDCESGSSDTCRLPLGDINLSDPVELSATVDFPDSSEVELVFE